MTEKDALKIIADQKNLDHGPDGYIWIYHKEIKENENVSDFAQRILDENNI